MKGPASIRSEGKVFVLGTDVTGKEVDVRPGKVLPFESMKDSRVRASLGRGGTYRILGRRRVGVSIWKDFSRTVSARKPRRIILLGATDTGKSTLATYLSNIALAAGLRVSIVDGDVGQGDLAPPGCIGASRVREQVLDLRDIDAEHYAFIGATSPAGIEDLVVSSMKRIVDRFSPGSDLCIINTDGYIDERGIDYKIGLARVLRPDLLVYLGSGRKARSQLEEFRERTVYADSPEIVSKSHREREDRRLDQYRRFVEGGGVVTFGIRRKKFGFRGRPCPVTQARDSSSIAIGSSRFPAWFLNGMFVGLGSSGIVRGFGVVLRVERGRVTLKTRYEGEFDTILLSTIRLAQNIREEYQIPLQIVAG
ncbi:MAG: Clp1/GlmU family protein [Nitrososphaerales archaeon]